jgi:hypothetical protein
MNTEQILNTASKIKQIQALKKGLDSFSVSVELEGFNTGLPVSVSNKLICEELSEEFHIKLKERVRIVIQSTIESLEVDLKEMGVEL